MPPPDPLVVEFNKAMYGIHHKAKVEAGYSASVFLRMLQDRGPLETAQFLIHTNKPSDGFTGSSDLAGQLGSRALT